VEISVELGKFFERLGLHRIGGRFVEAVDDIGWRFRRRE